MKDEARSSKGSGSPLIRLIQILPFMRFFEREIGSADRILDSFGLDRRMVSNDALFVHAEIIYGLTNGFCEAANDPFFGVRVGEWLPLSGRHSFAEPCRSARSIGEFLIRWLEQVPSEASSVRHNMNIGPRRTVYAVDRLLDPATSPAQAEGFAAAQYARLFEAITGANWDPARIGLETRYAHAIPAGYKGFMITSRAVPGLRLTFPTPWLHAPIDIENVIRSTRESRRLDVQPTASVATGVRGAVLSMRGTSEITPDSLARAIGLAPGALTKALRREGTTLTNEIRRAKIEMACGALKDPDQPISDIAALLGYREAANFTRFFRTHMGLSPRAYRKSQTGR